jgi:hypothetical protein
MVDWIRWLANSSRSVGMSINRLLVQLLEFKKTSSSIKIRINLNKAPVDLDESIRLRSWLSREQIWG